MRTSQKIALTILISLFITGGFGALAYTGLFTLLETDFFRERVIADQNSRLTTIAKSVIDWKSEMQERFNALAGDRNFQAVFSSTPQGKEIDYRATVSDSLEDKLTGYVGMRIVDDQGRIQHSTFAGDIAAEQAPVEGRDGRRLYRNWEQVSETFPLEVPNSSSVAFSIFNGVTGQVVFLIPAKDTGFVTRGWMIVYVSPSGLAEKLAGEGLIGAAGRVQVIDQRGVIVDIRPEQIEAVGNGIDLLWPRGGLPVEFAAVAESEGEKFFLASTVAEDGSWVGKLVPGYLLGFNWAIQILILAAVFISVSLMVFLFLNIRQDKIEIVRNRIKKLQVNLMRDWLENPENRRLTDADLESRRKEVKDELRSGLGLRKHQVDKADAIIDEGWNRIKEIFAERVTDSTRSSSGAAVAAAPPPIDMKKLEEMITRAVSEAKFVVPPEAFSGIHLQSAVPNVRPTPGRPVKIEVVDDDDLEDLDDVADLEDDGELEELEDVADLEDAVQPETPIKAAGPLDVEVLDELDDDGELEELEELEDFADLEDAAQPVSDGSEDLIGADDDFINIPDEKDQMDEVQDEDEYEDLSRFDGFEEISEVDETPDAILQDRTADMGQDSSDESSRTEFDDDEIEEPEVLESLEYIVDEEEVLEILPVVLSDDARDLIEIDKVQQDRVYMFDKEFQEPEEVQSETEEITEAVEILDLEIDEEFEDLPEQPGDTGILSGTAVQYFNIELIQERLKANEVAKKALSAGEDDRTDSISMESLIKMRTTDLLPGVDSLDDDFRFDDETAELEWSADGLNYDRYLRGFKRGTTGIYKSLMSLSKDYNAICGVLMAGSRKGLETDYTVGLNEESANHLTVTRNEPVWAEWFNKRRVVFVPDLSESLYAEKTRHNEFRFVRSAIFVPAVYHGSQSYLFFGFKDAPADPISLLAGLNPVK